LAAATRRKKKKKRKVRPSGPQRKKRKGPLSYLEGKRGTTQYCPNGETNLRQRFSKKKSRNQRISGRMKKKKRQHPPEGKDAYTKKTREGNERGPAKVNEKPGRWEEEKVPKPIQQASTMGHKNHVREKKPS